MPAMRNTVGKVCVSATTLAALTACMSSDSTPAVRATVTQMVTRGPGRQPLAPEIGLSVQPRRRALTGVSDLAGRLGDGRGLERHAPSFQR